MRIGARVLQDLQPQRLHDAVPAPAELEVEPLGATLVHRDQVLAAGLGPAHRPRRGACQPADDDVLDVEALAAEAAADVRRDHPHLVGLEPEHEPEHGLVGMRGLGRQPDGQPAIIAELCDRRARLDRQSRDLLALHRARDDHFAAVEQLRVRLGGWDVDTSVGPQPLEQHHLVADGLAGVGDGRQRVIFDRHELGGVGRAVAGLADHDGDDVADEADLLRGDERTEHLRIDRDERGWRADGQIDVAGREHLGAGHLEGGRGVDREDSRVRLVGAHELDVAFAREPKVIDIVALPGQEPWVLATTNPLSDYVGHALRTSVC